MSENALAIPREEMKEKVKALAKENFKKGPNCAESVYLALVEAGLVDFPPETVAMATPFGGGIGLSGGVCGALVAAIMGVGAVHGRRQPIEGNMQDIIDKLYGNPGLYRFFNQMPHEFEEKFGSTQCAILNKDYPNDWYNKDRLRGCMKFVVEAAGMAVDYIYQGAEEGYGQPFGKNMAGKV
jgi:C_GCAxxG_C_C family probable redox protein